MKTQPTYEIRVAGQLGETTAAVFAGLDVTYDGQVMVISGQFDQAALHGLLERIRLLALDLVEARRIGGTGRRAAGAAPAAIPPGARKLTAGG
jgi:hypothetical protein